MIDTETELALRKGLETSDFVTSYPLFVIVSIIMGWITFAKRKYLQLILWSVLPVIWWFIFFALGTIR